MRFLFFLFVKLHETSNNSSISKCQVDKYYEFPDQKLSDLIGNQSLDSDACSRHEFPDLIFSKPYGKFTTANVSRSMRRTRYDSLKDIKTTFLGTVFLCAVNIL